MDSKNGVNQVEKVSPILNETFDKGGKKSSVKMTNSSDNIEICSQQATKHKEVSTLEEMILWLEQLQENASDSVESALTAQLQVIRFVQSPSLVDTTLDTLILNLKKALRYANSTQMKDKSRECFSLMIQNYIFFFDARLQLEVNDNEDESKKLFETAGQLLSESVTEVALLAISGGTVTSSAIVKICVKNIFAQNNPERESFFNRCLKWWFREEEISKKKNEFYQILYNILLKLDKYNELIGPSILISGMIERYIPKIVDYMYEDKTDEIASSLTEQINALEEQPVFFSNKMFTYGIFFLGMGTILLRWIANGFATVSGIVFSWFSENYTATEQNAWFWEHFCWVLGLTAVGELFCCLRSIKKREKLKLVIENLEQQRDELFVRKEEFEKSLYGIAAKFNEI